MLIMKILHLLICLSVIVSLLMKSSVKCVRMDMLLMLILNVGNILLYLIVKYIIVMLKIKIAYLVINVLKVMF